MQETTRDMLPAGWDVATKISAACSDGSLPGVDPHTVTLGRNSDPNMPASAIVTRDDLVSSPKGTPSGAFFSALPTAF